MEFVLNKETMEFEPVKQPYKTVEIRCETEEDYNDFEKFVSLSQPKKPILSKEQVVRYVQTYECPNCEKLRMTNFEKIKSMSVHDMTRFLFIHQFDKCGDCGYHQKQCSGQYFDDKSCTMGIKHWLESEVEE